MDILFSVYMIGAIVMFCFVIVAMLFGLMFGGTIPWSWFVKAILIAATWPIMLAWGLANVVWIKIRT